MRFDELNEAPPDNIDAIEPAILGDDEIPDQNDQTDIIAQNEKDEDQIYEIEKIIKKRKVNGKEQYRVKWLSFDSKYNSWVDFDDLTQDCQNFVRKIKIPLCKKRR